MSQGVKRKKLPISSLRTRQSVHTVLLRMAADQARADRIRQLKLAHPDLTWKAIAEHVGVAERSAVEWQKSGGIGYRHAKKLAELFPEVTLDWLWRGDDEDETERETPDLLPNLNGSVPQQLQAQLDRIEERQLELLNRLDALLTRWDLLETTPPKAAPAAAPKGSTKQNAKTRTTGRAQGR